MNNSSHLRRLRIEGLEERQLLAVYSVTNLDDAGPGSLRDAVATANASVNTPDEIDFEVTGVISLTSGELRIMDSLTLRGPGQELLAIDAALGSRILHYSSLTGDLQVHGLTLRNGRTTADNTEYFDSTHSGGGIRFMSSGSLLLSNSEVIDNSTTGEFATGGAIFAESGSVHLNGSKVSGNVTYGDAARGGGIFARYGDIVLSNSSVNLNQTKAIVSDGGGIHTRSGDVVLIDSQVNGNSTAQTSSDGGGISSYHGNISLENSTVSGNTASFGTGAGIRAGDGIVTLVNSEVSGNRNGSYFSGPAIRGGGIYATSGSVFLTSSTVDNNIATGRN